MNIRFTAVVVGAVIVSIASGGAQVARPGKNLIDNGDFSAGIIHWKGDGKAEVVTSDPASAPKAGATTVSPNATTPAPPRPPVGGLLGKPGADVDRAYCVTLGARSQTFSQNFSVPRNAKVLKISFRVRTGDGFMTGRTTLGAFQFRLRNVDNNQTLFDEKVERSPGWQTIKENHTILEYSRNVDLVVEVFPGAGQLYFDDFVIEALER